jgi:anti-sigma regulatory factor (Ser/Thr protein kinase)
MLSGRRSSFRRSLRPARNAAFEARQALEDLRGQIDDDLLERMRLVVTEVISNSLKHAQLSASQAIELQVWAIPDLVRTEITDQGPGFDPVAARRDPNNSASGGWGLWLVDQLTDRWGVDHSHSTRVWLEFDRNSD